MNTKQNRSVVLSTAWIFVMFNMIYADIVSMLTPGHFEQMAQLSEVLNGPALVGISAMLEIPIAMVFLSLILGPKANRWAHTVAVPITALFVIGGGSLKPHYIFFASMEVLAMLYALWLVWQPLQANRLIRGERGQLA